MPPQFIAEPSCDGLEGYLGKILLHDDAGTGRLGLCQPTAIDTETPSVLRHSYSRLLLLLKHNTAAAAAAILGSPGATRQQIL